MAIDYRKVISDFKDFYDQKENINSSAKEILFDLKYYLSQKYILDRQIRGLKELFVKNWRNRHLPTQEYTLADLKRRKKDILFILGCNQSVNEIADSVLNKIDQYDSLGFNFWIYHKFVPTFYGLEYGKDPQVWYYFEQCIRRRESDYRDTIFLCHSRHWRRGWTPYVAPEFFPPNPKYFYYIYPSIARCPVERPFRKEDFERAMQYKGSLNLYLYVARLIGYKKIVLIGCEMNTAVTFYHDDPDLQWVYQIDKYTTPGIKTYVVPKDERSKHNYDGANATSGKHNIVDTIHAINEFVLKPEGIELYVFNKKSLFYPEIPLFEF